MHFVTKFNYLLIIIDQLFILSKQKSKFFGIILSLLLFQLIISLMNPVHGIKWLGIYRLPKSADHPVDSTADRFTPDECQKAANKLGLRRRQARFCMHPRFGYAMLAVLRAAHAVGYHCPKTFSDRRWNCTSIHQLPHVSPELRRGTREQAIVHAFASSVLLFEIGRYCALNKIRYCSCGDEDGSYATPNYPSSHLYKNNNNNLLRQQTLYNDNNNALVYNSDGHSINSIDTSKSNNIPMTDGQPTVSKFYWAGCSDNLRTAKEYTSLFLGFPNVHVMLPPPMETDNPNLDSIQDMNNQNRYKRSTYSSHVTESNYDTTEISDMFSLFQNQINVNENVDDRVREEDPEEEIEENEGEDDSEIDDSKLFHLQHEYTDRRRRNLHKTWSYQSTAQTNKYPSYSSAQQMYDLIDDNDERLPRHARSKQGRKKYLLRSLNRHNYLAGVVLMEANQKLVCKCHGVSGSCAQRVCFRQLRRIDTEIMQKALKMRYLAAKQVSEGKNGELIAKTFIGNGFIDEVVKPGELVFSEHSPDYCNVEPQRGSVGTRDRICTLKDTGTSNCVNMCCGRGYRNVTKREIVQCNCRMANGFKVQCDECNVETVTQRCL
ncbi:unnamed protein product [Schistosoma rodhaini]|uniref:Protein Wnt n=2 Tax=Schistosoma rodhaini TaxID=6188 RepID=A0AA85FK21_9TREM|nr:unnamed protein product [Schistosoma rodhaini]